jgi:hypothetical protein
MSGVGAIDERAAAPQEPVEVQYPCGCQESADGTIVHVCGPHLRAACERKGIHLDAESP